MPRVGRPLAAAGGSGLVGAAPDGNETYFSPVADWVEARRERGSRNVIAIITDAQVPDADKALRRLQGAGRVVVIQIAHQHAGAVTTPGVDVIQATTERPQAVAAAVARVLLSVTGQGAK